MKIIQDIKQMISIRNEKITQQADENIKLENELLELDETIKEKEKEYIATLEPSMLEELEKLKYKYDLLEKAIHNKQSMLNVAKEAKYNLKWEAIGKEIDQVIKGIKLDKKIEAIEEAKKNYIRTLEIACNGAEEIRHKFKELEQYQKYMDLDMQRNIERECIRVFNNIYIDGLETWQEEKLRRKLFSITNYKPIFKELNNARNEKENLTGVVNADEY